MTIVSDRIKQILQSPWTVALVILLIFLRINQYRYGWDDQHLEIPLLKHLIDPTLYAGDYYVESLAKNFTSFFFPILSKLITIDQIPPVYFFLYIVSRYFLFFWTYKIWLHFSQSRLQAFCCCMAFLLVSRVDEFLYRTFSHQEFALAAIIAGIYFFFKERYYLSAAILGVSANFHALYSAFPMMFMGMYLLVFIRKEGWRKLVISSAIFLACAFPFIIWTAINRLTNASTPPEILDNWQILYRVACPQNFMFPNVKLLDLLFHKTETFFILIEPYLFLAALFILNLTINEKFQKNAKAVIFCLTAFAMLIFTFIFTHIYPVKFVLDLNSIRNAQYLSYLLMGFTTLLVFDVCRRKKPVDALMIVILFALIKYSNLIAVLALMIILLTGIAERAKNIRSQTLKWATLALLLILIALCAGGIVHYFSKITFTYIIRLLIVIIVIACLGAYLAVLWLRGTSQARFIQQNMILIPLSVFLVHFIHFHDVRVKEETYGAGYWSLHRNYEDMQRFVKANTPKDALFLVPHNMEMENFRTFSERKIIASFRDCGIVGFDYLAALEWRQRLSDIQDFKVVLTEPPVNAIKNAIMKYNADYIVFMRYATPMINVGFLQEVYYNNEFALYKVVKD